MRKFRLQLIYIGNIPNDYHAKDLRNFFKYFVETERFFVFHFRHRPEIIDFDGNLKHVSFKPKRSNHKSLCAFSVINHNDNDRFVNCFHDKHWLDTDSIKPRFSKCKIILSESFDSIPSELSRTIIELDPPIDLPQGNVGTPFRYFFDLNMKCQLRLDWIRKLGLDLNGACKASKYQSISTTTIDRMSDRVFIMGRYYRI